MPGQFLHGVEVVEVDSGPRPIRTLKSSVIGIVGTAPAADVDAFPLNTPVLIAGSRFEAAQLDPNNTGLGTLPKSLDGILDQGGAAVVVIRVDEGVDSAATQTNIIGGVDAPSGQYLGAEALLGAESIVGVQPRILIAPGFTQELAVATALQTIAEKLHAVVVIDGPNTNDADAQTYRGNFGSDRLYLVDPWVEVFDTVAAATAVEPSSARVAGLMAKMDNDLGFWHSPSNKLITGITGTSRPIDFKLGDANSRANLLNENEITTIIRQDGYRLWGNRTCASDPKFAFLSVRRTADLIQDSLQRAHLWAVDRNLTKTYISDVVESVNAYLRELVNLGAILGGQCWADPGDNPPSALAAGKVTFEFDFTPPTPAEHITFKSRLVNDYFEEVVNP